MLDRVAELLEPLGAELHERRSARLASGAPVDRAFGAEGDRFAHARLARELPAIMPSLPVISEEDRESQTGPRPARYWLIDPIDGTASYCGGYPGYVTQLALMENGRPVLGAVYAPATRELFLAERGAGATRNGTSLRLPETPARRRLIDNYPEPRATAAQMMPLLRCDGYVESGSLGLKICRIADGTAEIFFKDIVLRDWDIAPAALVLEEAGGVVTAVSGEEFAYDGDFEKPGVIAAATAALAMATADALQGVTA